MWIRYSTNFFMNDTFTAQLTYLGAALYFLRKGFSVCVPELPLGRKIGSQGVKFLTKIWKSIEKKMKKGYNYNRLKFCLSLNFYKMEGKREGVMQHKA